ncbi:polysaccharide biosynthesis tyrosine autokinase [bacterium]|nr:polysaccharide biosynthesis tyrosine autokinase [bacterium]
MNDNFAEMRQYQMPGEDASGFSPDGITFMSVLLAVIKRPWIIVSSILIVIVPLLFYLLSISTVYKSSATVMVSVRESSFLDAVSLVEGGRSDAKSENYYTSILESRAYRDDVAKQIIILNPDMPKDSIASASRNGIGYYSNRRKPGFIQIYANSRSKAFAKLLAETALDKFKARSIDLQREDAIHISDFINNQVESISEKLSIAEEELQLFLNQKNLILVGTETGITHELFELELKNNEAKANLEMIAININYFDQQMNDLLNKLTDENKAVDETKIIQLKSRLAEIRRALDNAVSLKLNQAQIQVLKVERDGLRSELIGYLTPTSPDHKGSVSNVGVTLQKLEEELEGAFLKQTEFQNQVTFYGLQIERFRKEHPNLSGDILTYASLSRAKEVLRKTLDILLEKREEIRIRVESEMGGIKVIDAPRLPNLPIARKRMQKLIIGILAALGLGVVASVILDRFDNTIKDENDIHRSYDFTVFGTIPAIDDDRYQGLRYDKYSRKRDDKFKIDIKQDGADSKGNEKLLFNYSEKSPIAEAYRSLKINLQFLATDKAKKMFVISSPSASEGKSMTTSNLGISFARGGARTLIIDCDLRKSVQHKHFDVKKKPGLTNYLYGEVELKDIIRDIDVDHLSVIPAGASPSNPAGLLASEKMHTLLDELRSQFDFILIDTPPILVCSDSRIIAEYVDGMIVIAKVESTNIKALDHSIQLTKHLNIDILGIILNQVEFRFGRAYYYTYRYYKPYSYYSGYYYKRAYYDYTEGEEGEKVRVPRSGKGERNKISSSKKV